MEIRNEEVDPMAVHERRPAYKRGWKVGYAARRSMNARAGERRLARPRHDAFGQTIKESRFGGVGFGGIRP